MSIDDFQHLQEDILSAIDSNTPEATGFYAVKCPVCNKDSNKKTGGFRFEPDQIIYNCFRATCDSNTVYTHGEYVPKKLRTLLDHYGVEIPIGLRIRKQNQRFARTIAEIREDNNKSKEIDAHRYKPVPIPEHSIPIADGGELGAAWQAYYQGRLIDTTGFRVVTSGAYAGCAVIPIYCYSQIIGWNYHTNQGVYVNFSSGNTHLVNMRPPRGDLVIVVEGLLDSYSLPNTVGVLSGSVSKEQASLLRDKNVILLPDRSGNKFLDAMAQYGWSMSLPNWSAKDLNAAVCKYGKIVATQMILDAKLDSVLKAKTRYKLWCKRD